MSQRLSSKTSKYICRSCRHQIYKSQPRNFATSSQTDESTPKIFDVVTVGGGPVGLALLAALKSSPVTSHLKCALIETQDLSKARSWNLPPDQYSNRASSLTPTNVSFLNDIGAWRHVDQSRVQPYDEMQVWDAGNDSSLQFDWQAEAIQYNAPLRTVATMTENANLTKGLLDRLSELQADGSLLTSTSVSSIENGKDDLEAGDLSTWPILSLKSTSTDSSSSASRIAARLLIGADGLNSPVRTFAGINANGWDYNRHGVVATLKVEYQNQEPETFSAGTLESFLSEEEESSSSNRATAFQRFLPSLGGPIAILPLPNNHASLVWSTTPQTASYLKSLPSTSFVATVNAALRLRQVDIKYMMTLPTNSESHSTNQHIKELEWRLQHTTAPSLPSNRQPPQIVDVQPGTVASFPLRLRQATSYTAPRIALAGDAAHTIHPLAGQGLNLGLGDAEALTRTIAYAVEHGIDLGDLMALEPYGRERYGKALMMAGGVDALNWMYQLGGEGDGITSSVISRMRGVGMDVMNRFPGLKEMIMRRAD